MKLSKFLMKFVIMVDILKKYFFSNCRFTVKTFFKNKCANKLDFFLYGHIFWKKSKENNIWGYFWELTNKMLTVFDLYWDTKFCTHFFFIFFFFSKKIEKSADVQGGKINK